MITNRILEGLVGINAMVRGYRFKIAETQQELQDAFDLRFNIYRNEVLHTSNPYPDEYDAHAVILIAYKGKTAIATMRMVLAEKGNLTTDLYCPDLLDTISPQDSVEIGGLAIEKAHRGGSRFVFASLLRLGLVWCELNQRSFWIGISSLKKVELFKTLNPNLIIREAVEENALAFHYRPKRRENDLIQIKGKKPIPFLIDISSVNYFAAVRFYLRKMLGRKPKKAKASQKPVQLLR